MQRIDKAADTDHHEAERQAPGYKLSSWAGHDRYIPRFAGESIQHVIGH
jgi:hypothetical protein